MGIPSKSLTPKQLAAGGLRRDAAGRVSPRLGNSLAGWFWGFLAGDPPTVTHHDKVIGWRFGRGGKRIAALRNSPALERAWDWHLARIPERSGPLVPLRPPVLLRAVWCWRLPDDRADWPEYAQPGGYRIDKPDLDNLGKLLRDALALRGFVGDDAHIVADGGSQKRWCEPGEQPGILVYARSLANKYDEGPPPQPASGDLPWCVRPVAWQLEQDLCDLAIIPPPQHVAIKRTVRLMPDPDATPDDEPGEAPNPFLSQRARPRGSAR